MRTGWMHTGITTFMLVAAMAVSVVADGFRNPPEGAAALGRAGTRLTQGDDPSAISHNPANLMDLDGPVVMPTVTIGYSLAEFTPTGGQTEESKDPWRLLPAIYAAWPASDRYTLGVGINFPYGQSTEWGLDGAFQAGAPYFAEMTTLNVTPAIAARVSDTLSVGAGANLMQSDLEFRQQMSSGGGLVPLSFEGDGYGIGAKVGLTWDLTEKQRVAVTYQSPVDITYEGDFAGGSGPGAMSSDFETELRFPSIVALGYGIQATDTVRLEANVEWVEHSRNEEMNIDIGPYNGLLAASMGSTTIPQNWDDEWVVDVGADWQCAESCVVRAGWTYLPTPIPDETFMSTLPEGDKNIFAVGMGFGGERHALDVAYSLNVVDDRTVTTPVPGTYEFDSHLIGVSYRCAL